MLSKKELPASCRESHTAAAAAQTNPHAATHQEATATRTARTSHHSQASPQARRNPLEHAQKPPANSHQRRRIPTHQQSSKQQQGRIRMSTEGRGHPAQRNAVAARGSPHRSWGVRLPKPTPARKDNPVQAGLPGGHGHAEVGFPIAAVPAMSAPAAPHPPPSQPTHPAGRAPGRRAQQQGATGSATAWACHSHRTTRGPASTCSAHGVASAPGQRTPGTQAVRQPHGTTLQTFTFLGHGCCRSVRLHMLPALRFTSRRATWPVAALPTPQCPSHSSRAQQQQHRRARARAPPSGRLIPPARCPAPRAPANPPPPRDRQTLFKKQQTHPPPPTQLPGAV
jgi:exonuclease VII large subunit